MDSIIIYRDKIIVGQHYQVRHGLLLLSFTGIANDSDVISQSEGVYYLAPLGSKWLVVAYRYADVDREIDHLEFWEFHVCQRLAAYWCTKLAIPYNKLRKRLSEYPYGLPRGRVACVGGLYHVYHGADLSNALGVNRGTIEAIFGIRRKSKWVSDDHEHCLMADKEALRETLALEVDWDAV